MCWSWKKTTGKLGRGAKLVLNPQLEPGNHRKTEITLSKSRDMHIPTTKSLSV